MVTPIVTKSEEINNSLTYDSVLHIATAHSRKATTWKNTEILWSDFVKKISQTTRTPETVVEYKSLPKAAQDEIKDVGGFVFGSLIGGKRKADSVASRQVVTLDADFVKGDLWSGITLVFDHAVAIYSTHKHSSLTPRYRVLIPLDRAVSPTEYEAISRQLAKLFGMDFFDETTHQPHRLMYWPSTSSDGEYVYEVQDASFLNADSVLALYNDWRDPLQWPRHASFQKEITKKASKQGNPLEKPGIVGAFCRAYSLEEAIQTFLSDKYEDAGRGRYTYLNGSTTGGLILYEGGLFAYSHHGTDPASGKLLNSFDLVRLHLFGELDVDAKEGTPINRIPSYLAFIEWVTSSQDESLAGVKLELRKANINSSALEDFEDDLPSEEGESSFNMDELLNSLSVTKSGKIEPSTANIERIIKAMYSHTFKFDEFSQKAIRVANVPWRQNQQLKAGEVTQWDDDDSNFMLLEIEKIFEINIPFAKAQIVIDKVVQEQSFHPIKDIILNKPWDGIKRAETLLIDYMGADDSEYVRLATKHFLIGALKRLWEPGCKFDECLVLIGKQGIAKSLLTINLAFGTQWHTDSLESFDSKKGAEVLQSKWLVELGELAAMKKAEVNEVKRFITSQVDTFRGAYQRKAKDVPRKCAFIGTSNESEFLTDPTGNRRFLPVECYGAKRKKHPSELNEAETQQMWAEVYERWLQPNLGKPHFMPDKLRSLAEEQHKEHILLDSRLSEVQHYLNKPRPIDFDSNPYWTKEKRTAWINHLTGSAEDNYNDLSTEERHKWYLENHDYVPYQEFEKFRELIIPSRISSQEIMFEALGMDSKARINPYEARELVKLIKQAGWEQKTAQAKKLTKAYGQVKAFDRPSN